MKYADFDLGGDAATKRLAAGWGDMGKRLAEVAGTDYMGDFLGDVQRRAHENYNVGLEQTDKSARAAAKGLTATKEAAAEVNRETEFYRGTFQSLFADIKTGLKEGETFWQALGNAGTNARQNCRPGLEHGRWRHFRYALWCGDGRLRRLNLAEPPCHPVALFRA